MRWTHESLGELRGMITVIMITLFPCGDLVATLQAATPPAQPTYRSSGSANPDEARRVVMNLGVGQHVVVTLSSGETVRGEIREIADDHFVILLEGSADPADITYGDVRQLGPILLQPVPRPRSRNRRALIAVVLVVILAIASYTVQGCGDSDAC